MSESRMKRGFHKAKVASISAFKEIERKGQGNVHLFFRSMSTSSDGWHINRNGHKCIHSRG